MPYAEEMRNRDRERPRWLDRIYAQWRGGSYANAMRAIDAEVAAASDPLSE